MGTRDNPYYKYYDEAILDDEDISFLDWHMNELCEATYVLHHQFKWMFAAIDNNDMEKLKQLVEDTFEVVEKTQSLANSLYYGAWLGLVGEER